MYTGVMEVHLAPELQAQFDQLLADMRRTLLRIRGNGMIGLEKEALS